MMGGFREHRAGCPTEPELRRNLGCDEEAPRAVFSLGGVEHRRCPMHYLDDDAWEFLRSYGHYQAGFLPESGGIADQSATFLAACAYLGSELERLRQRNVREET